jgi:hypothetical protein
MKKLTTIIGALLLSSCIHNEYLYDGMIKDDYVKFEIIRESKPGKFKDLQGKVREKEYVPLYNLMTIITADRDTVQLYDIDNNLKPDYVVSSYKGLGFRIAPIETLKLNLQDFIFSQWNYNLRMIDSIKKQ